VSQADARLKEAGKLGFTTALVPPRRSANKARRAGDSAIVASEISHLRQLVELFSDAASQRTRRRVEA
jgi:DNA repair protein RadA/Sms